MLMVAWMAVIFAGVQCAVAWTQSIWSSAAPKALMRYSCDGCFSVIDTQWTVAHNSAVPKWTVRFQWTVVTQCGPDGQCSPMCSPNMLLRWLPYICHVVSQCSRKHSYCSTHAKAKRPNRPRPDKTGLGCVATPFCAHSQCSTLTLLVTNSQTCCGAVSMIG